MSFLTKILGDPNKKVIADLQDRVTAVNALESEIANLSDTELASAIRSIREEKPSSQDLATRLPRVFSIVRETAKRVIGLRHFDAQIMGGIILHEGKIAEMKTGEGKTLVATLPATLNALVGKGVHIVTVNDYLAKRDARWMGQVYQALGLTVGTIQHEAAFRYDPTYTEGAEPEHFLRPVQRREAYQADILYGTNNEFGFDYLRDNMVASLEQKVQGPLGYAIVDEVDSILIDEARTPLIISAPAEDSTDQYYRFAQLVPRLAENTDYNVDEKMRSATLTEEGMNKMERLLNVRNIYEEGGVELAHHLEQALKAQTLFKRDRDYVVREGEVVIVDEFTGRLMFGRRYSEGLHQAIEAKEGVKIQQESRTLATITFQNYFRLYEKLSGMTGTAATEAEEFAKIYNLEVTEIPTNKPMIRGDLNDAVFLNEEGKYQAVVREIKQRHETGQPVLVGTISIEKNEILHELLSRDGIPHEILNAKNHEREAAIISQAGREGAVTVATNMAGRGVDIILGGNPPKPEEQEKVRRAGGLHVLGTERHEARRIDNQLRGRSGRQGDPGSSQFFVSLDDDLMRIFGSGRVKGVMERLNLPPDLPIENRMVSRSIEAAQRKIEGHNFDIRKHLVEYDDVMNKHREVIYRRRNAVLNQDDVAFLADVRELLDEEIERLVAFHTAGDNDSRWDVKEIYESVNSLFPISAAERKTLQELRLSVHEKTDQPRARDTIFQHLATLARVSMDSLGTRFGGPASLATVARSVLLRTIDTLWIEHLDQMEYLREGIGLRGYGQRDPLVEYKREAFRLFSELSQSINGTFVNTVFKIDAVPTLTTLSTPLTAAQRIETGPSKSSSTSSPIVAMNADNAATPPRALQSLSSPQNRMDKVGRNEPCPCGSGKKFKKCHGA